MASITPQMLATISLFANMNDKERAEVLEIMSERAFPPGQHITKAGEASDAFYIIQRGEVEIFLTDTGGEKVVLDVLGPGKFFGELSMLSGETRSASVISKEELVTLELDRKEFFDFLRARPDVAINILEELGQRLKHTDDILRTRVGQNPNEGHNESLSLGQRVADLIAAFSGSIPFLLINLVIFVIWILLNTIGPSESRFDLYPFQFLTMAVSLEAIFLSIFVLVSQNRQAAKDRLKTDLDYQVDVKTGLELSELTTRVREIDRRLEKIHDHILETKPAKETPPEPN